MAYEKEALDLNFLDAKRITSADNTQTNDRETVLIWTRVGDDRRQTCLDYLKSISTITNQKYDSGKATLSGLWRNAGSGYNNQGGYYFLTLRYGYAITTPEAAAVYVNLTRYNQSGKLELVRKWQFIDPAVIEKLLNSDNANPKVLANVVTDPVAYDAATGTLSTYEGEWLAVTTQGSKSAQDGCTIVQTLIKAGDANLTVILGTNKTTSSRECYKWQTTAEDLDAFRTHTGVYAAEFDYKWETNETGIQKDWQPSQNGDDKSLNLVARYIVKEPWLYPANGTDFVVVNNLNGIYSESVRKFKNTTLPVASAGELVKALEDELGQFSGEVIKRVVLNTGGTAGVFTMVASSIYEWATDRDVVKIPVWTTFSDSSIEPKIIAYNVFKLVCPFRRKVTVKVERQYYATMISCVPQDGNNSGFVNGGGVAIIKNVIEISEGLYAIEAKTITVEDWSNMPTQTIALYSTTA